MQWAPLPRRDEPQYKYLDYSAKPTRRIVIKARKRKRVQWAPLPHRGVAEENKGRTGSRGCDSSVGGRAAKEARLPKGGTRSAPEMNKADKTNLSRGGSGRRGFPEVQSDVAFTSTVVDTMDEMDPDIGEAELARESALQQYLRALGEIIDDNEFSAHLAALGSPQGEETTVQSTRGHFSAGLEEDAAESQSTAVSADIV